MCALEAEWPLRLVVVAEDPVHGINQALDFQ